MQVDPFQCCIIHNQLLFKFPHASFNSDMTEKTPGKTTFGLPTQRHFLGKSTVILKTRFS